MQTSVDWTQMPNPKRPVKDAGGRHSWYPFYPGFSIEFASWILRNLATPGSLLLDPWNGSGATTSLAAERGLGAIGVDLNPAMVVIAKAKLLDPLDVDSVRALTRQIVKIARGRKDSALSGTDPLAELFAHEGAPGLRAIERSIRQLLVDAPTSENSEQLPDVTRISPIAAFFYVGLFRVCRALLRDFGTTNPVWTKLSE